MKRNSEFPCWNNLINMLSMVLLMRRLNKQARIYNLKYYLYMIYLPTSYSLKPVYINWSLIIGSLNIKNMDANTQLLITRNALKFENIERYEISFFFCCYNYCDSVFDSELIAVNECSSLWLLSLFTFKDSGIEQWVKKPHNNIKTPVP